VEVKDEILARFGKYNESWPHDTERRNYFLDGLSGSSVLFYIASSFKSKPMSILYVADDKDKAAYSYDTLMTLLGGDIMLLTDSFQASREFCRNQYSQCFEAF
jgi:hypothetical protein